MRHACHGRLRPGMQGEHAVFFAVVLNEPQFAFGDGEHFGQCKIQQLFHRVGLTLRDSQQALQTVFFEFALVSRLAYAR